MLATVVVCREARRWWPAAVVGALVYGVWFLVFRVSGGLADSSINFGLDALATMPMLAFEMGSTAVERLIGIGGWLAVGLTVGLLVGLAVALVRRNLGSADALHLWSAAAFVGLALLVRVVEGQAQVSAVRYTYNVTLLLLPVVIPRIRLPDHPAVPVGVIMLSGLMAWSNLQMLDRGLDFWESRSQASRQVVESAASLLAEGEPYVPSSAIDPPRALQLSAGKLHGLVEGGWRPELSADADSVRTARGDLRVQVSRWRGPALACSMSSSHDLSPGTVALFRGPADVAGQILWRDRFGPGIQELGIGREVGESAR